MKALFPSTAVASLALATVLGLAGCATSEPPVEQPVAQEPAAQEPPAQEPAHDDLAIDTSYYTITLPESWRDVFEYEYSDEYTIDPSSKGTDQELGIGYSTQVKNTATGESFSVTIFTDTWGPQGITNSKKLDAPAALPGNYVCVTAPVLEPFNGFDAYTQEQKDTMEAQINEYASWITVK